MIFNGRGVISFLSRLCEMAEGELKDMESFFSTLPTPFAAFESEAYKTSVVGEFSTPYNKS